MQDLRKIVLRCVAGALLVTAWGCMYRPCSLTVNGTVSDFTVMPMEIVYGTRKVDGPFDYCAQVAGNVRLPKNSPYREFAEKIITECVNGSVYVKDSVFLHKNCTLFGTDGIADRFFRLWQTDEEAIRNYSWCLEIRGDIVWLSGDYVSYRAESKGYQGGCNMSDGDRYLNGTWSKSLGRRIKREDLLDTRDYAKIGTLIAQAVVDDERNTERSRLNFDGALKRDWPSPSPEALVTDNFMLMRGGVVWTYNRYDHWSGSEGFSDAFVPYCLLAPYLRDKTLVSVSDDPKVDGSNVRAMLDYHESNWMLWH